MTNKYHETVMTHEVLDILHIQKNKKYIDATLGNAGHTIEIAKQGGIVLGIDTDPEMLEMAKTRIGENKNITLVNGNFANIEKIAKDNNFTNVAGIVYDLGVSNIHLKSIERGFSFENPKAVLDMRLNNVDQGVKAADLLNVLREDHLIEMFGRVMDPSSTRWITKRVIERRNLRPFETVGDLLEVTEDLKGKVGLNPATLPFLALRIAVNSELDNLKVSLSQAYELLEKGGKLVVISFHSGEDSIVRSFFKDKLSYLGPSPTEVKNNPRSRSARLRFITK